MNSIRQRLLIWQITALVVTAVLVSALTYRLALNGFNRVRDYGLQQIAYSVVRHGVRPQPGRATAPLPPPEADVAPAPPVPADGKPSYGKVDVNGHALLFAVNKVNPVYPAGKRLKNPAPAPEAP